MADKKRVSFYLEQEELNSIDRLKQVMFYDKSYAELFRHLIRLGLEKAKEK